MVLPLRETALVAKQAAAVDVLSGGRLRLGVAVGLNDVEYDAMGKGFHDRGARMEEQIEVLRLLWTRDLVTFEGRWHKITDAGINPLPVRRPIPLWMGGGADPVVRRIGRLADGWMLPGTMRRPEDAARSHRRDAGPRPAGGPRSRRDRPAEGRLGRWPGGVGELDTRVAAAWSYPLRGQRERADAGRTVREATAVPRNRIRGGRLMRIGVVFPQIEIGPDPAAVRDYVAGG